MMKVLHCVASLAPRHGGPTVAVLGMVRALRAEGCDARIVSSDDDLGGRLAVPLREWVEYEGVPVLFLPRVQARQHTLVGFTYTPGVRAWMQSHVQEFDFVHVHTVFSHPANVAMQVCRSAGVPYCVRPLGQLCRWSMQQRGWVKRLQLALLTRRNLDGAAFIHCTSQMEADESAEVGSTSSCAVLPHGLDLPPVIRDARALLRTELGVMQDRLLVVFMSRFHPKKGLELLLDATARLSVPFDLLLAGAGDASYVDELKQRVIQRGLEGRVRWLGFLEGDEKWRLLQGADLFVLPSHSENFGIAVLEAVACGLPVVVSDQVALQDEVRALSLGRVVPLDEEALMAAISTLLLSEADRAAISARAVAAAAENFSWSAAARRLMTAYQSAISHS
jgi:glycosyltransferase involved in cell wall biosynthesis